MGSKGSTTTSSYKPPAEVMDAYRKATQMGYAASQQPFQAYGGEMVAGLNPTQIAGIQNVNNAQGAALPFYNAATQYATQAARPISAGDINQYMSPYLGNVAAATQANILEQNAQQQQALKSGAIRSGAFGGDRSGIAMAQLAREQGLAGGANMANIYNTGYNQAMSGLQNQYAREAGTAQMLQGLGGASQQAMLSGAQAQMAAGAQQQATQQAYDQAMYNQFLQQQAYPFQMAQYFANIAEGIGAGAGGTGTTTMPGPNVASQALGFGTAMASIPWSDERLKENIEAVGKTHDGQTIYKYNFKGSPKTELGLIAQEVEGKHPDAVHEIGGLKAVDYDKAIPSRHEKAAGGSAYMGGVVRPDVERQHFAQGGLGMIPYEDFASGISYVPSGETEKHQKPGAWMGWVKAPEYQDKGLDDTWSQIRGMTDAQKQNFAKNLKGLYNDVTSPSASDYYGQPGYDVVSHAAPESTGGFVRHGYANAGVVPPAPQADDDTPVAPAQTGVVPPPKAPDVSNVMNSAIDMVLRHEGGLLEKDTNGTPSNRGINQAAHPNINVRDLTEDQTRQIYANDYWKPINGDALAAKDPNFAKVAMDISVTSGPGRARQLIAQSGGDPQKLLGLYSNFLGSLVQKNPQKYGDFAGPWQDRMQSLAKEISAQPTEAGLGNVVVNPTADTPDQAPQQSSGGLGAFFSKLFHSTPDGGNPGSEEHKRNLIERITNSDMSPDMQRALLSAGFAMMAGRSPFFGVNVGEAGKAGMQTYYNQQMLPFQQQKLLSEIGLQRAQANQANIEAQSKILPIITNAISQSIVSKQPLPQNVLDYIKQLGPMAIMALPPQYQAKVQSDMAASGVAPPAAGGPSGLQGATTDQPTPSAGVGGGEAVQQEEAGVAPPPSSAPQPSEEKVQIGPTTETGNPVPSYVYSPDGQKVPTSQVLNQTSDPNFWRNLAATSGPMYAQTYRDKADAAEKAIIENKGFMGTDGVFYRPPGFYEAERRGEQLKSDVEANTKITNERIGAAEENIKGYNQAVTVFSQLAKSLSQKAPGAMEDIRSAIVTSLDGVGFKQTASMLKEAAQNQEQQKLFAQLLFSDNLKEKLPSNFAARELDVYQKQLGSSKLQPATDRFILGSARGRADWKHKMETELVDAIGDQKWSIQQIAKWENDWTKQPENNLGNFIVEATKRTPVKGEIDWDHPDQLKPTDFVDGFAYIMKDGSTAIYHADETGPDAWTHLTKDEADKLYE